MSKLMSKAKNSKLKESLEEAVNPTVKKEKLIREIKNKEYPRSYRFDSETRNILRDTLDRINEVTPKKIGEARLVKALIILSKEIEDDQILKALKEVW